MENKTINPEVLAKTHKALIELNKLIRADLWTSKHSNEVLSKNKVDMALMSQAIRAGIFKRIERGKYKSSLSQIDPIHARQCIEQRDILAKENWNKRQDKPKEKAVKQIQPPRKHLAAKKTFSVLWGLFKYSF